MPQYECAIVLTPTLSEEQLQEQIEQVKAWIAGLGAEVSDVDIWGRKRLAYPIGKQREGFYVIYYFALDQEHGRLTEFEKRLNTVEAVLRHLLVRLPKLKEPPRLPSEEEESGKGEPAEPSEEKSAAEVKETEPAKAAVSESSTTAEQLKPAAPAPLASAEQPESASPKPETVGEQEGSATPTTATGEK